MGPGVPCTHGSMRAPPLPPHRRRKVHGSRLGSVESIRCVRSGGAAPIAARPVERDLAGAVQGQGGSQVQRLAVAPLQHARAGGAAGAGLRGKGRAAALGLWVNAAPAFPWRVWAAGCSASTLCLLSAARAGKSAPSRGASGRGRGLRAAGLPPRPRRRGLTPLQARAAAPPGRAASAVSAPCLAWRSGALKWLWKAVHVFVGGDLADRLGSDCSWSGGGAGGTRGARQSISSRSFSAACNFSTSHITAVQLEVSEQRRISFKVPEAAEQQGARPPAQARRYRCACPAPASSKPCSASSSGCALRHSHCSSCGGRRRGGRPRGVQPACFCTASWRIPSRPVPPAGHACCQACSQRVPVAYSVAHRPHQVAAEKFFEGLGLAVHVVQILFGNVAAAEGMERGRKEGTHQRLGVGARRRPRNFGQ